MARVSGWAWTLTRMLFTAGWLLLVGYLCWTAVR